MLGSLITKVIGTRNERYLKSLRPVVAEINSLESRMREMADEDFPRRISELREEVAGGLSLDDALPEVFALVREGGRRALNMRHFDVQLVGGMVLHHGKIAEMKTGEGKTLVATLAVVLNALAGKGVHVVTVNDYLASRDAEWMGQLYGFLGLTTGVIVHGLSDEERKAAYAADITYGTNNEFGFDYLRDNMKFYKEQLVMRDPFYAIVDEVDSILIDEARTPLIISGAAEGATGMYAQVDAIIPSLKREEHFTVDEKARSVTLTDDGVTRCEEILKIDNLFDPANVSFQHHILQALKAHYLFTRDADYVVKDGQVVIVDEFTGRLMPGRRFSDGLHQALEAKESVKVEAENQTYASITFQNYFRMYDKLAGMTGTADTESVEFAQIYDLEVSVIPTNVPMLRNDYPDAIYRTQDEKYAAIVQDIIECHRKGQPVLVGTVTIEKSERISRQLTKARVPHEVLNAKNHTREAEIIAHAGEKGRVTIATNMAGRGTDIKLGEGVKELGGLHILGTERHESRRIDNQLRGRAGRQGDPGSSRFYLALDDDLMRIFGSERISGMMEKLGMEEGMAIENKIVSRAIENAQKRVEGHNFDIRKQLLDFDNVMNQQREVIYGLRRELMFSESMRDVIDEFVDDVLDEIYEPLSGKRSDQEVVDGVKARLEEVFNLSRVLGREWEMPEQEDAAAAVRKLLDSLSDDLPEQYPFDEILRFFALESLDRGWKEHLLNMDHLREGIGLRGYGQRDPKQEYKREGFSLFAEMVTMIKANTLKPLSRLKIEREPEPEKEDTLFRHKGAAPEENLDYAGAGDQKESQKPKTQRRNMPKVGRNDPCPCGSGKKYKKCCGK